MQVAHLGRLPHPRSEFLRVGGTDDKICDGRFVGFGRSCGPTPMADAGPHTLVTDGGLADAGAGGLFFQKTVLSSSFFAEGANYGDFTNDGIADVVAGPYIYLGPDFVIQQAYRPVETFDPVGYSNNFFVFPYEFDGDG